MYTFREYNILENFKNFIDPEETRDQRLKYVDQVWDILQASYKDIGGIKGSGFKDKEDMVKTIAFWKIFTRAEKVIAVAMYKDKSGRKGVAYGSDGSDDSKKVMASIFSADLDKSYSELSGRALGFVLKSVDPSVIQPFFMPVEKVKETLAGKKIIELENIEDDNAVVANLDEKDQKLWAKWPNLRRFFYVRELAGELKLKLSIGTTSIPVLKN